MNFDELLKLALAGGAVAATGGAAAPAVLGAEAGAAGAAGVGLLGTEAATAAVPATGLLGGLQTAGQWAKPVGQALGAAGSVQGLLANHNQPMQAPQVAQSQGGAQSLAGLYSQITQQEATRQQEENQRRAQRRGLLGGA